QPTFRHQGVAHGRVVSAEPHVDGDAGRSSLDAEVGFEWFDGEVPQHRDPDAALFGWSLRAHFAGGRQISAYRRFFPHPGETALEVARNGRVHHVVLPWAAQTA